MNAINELGIVTSNLSGVYSSEGEQLVVQIYKQKCDPGWVLEVQNTQGGSTFWETLFPSDQEALSEFNKSLKHQGISSFAAHGI